MVSKCALSKIPRSLYEDARDRARALKNTREYRQSRRDRKKVEVLFAHITRILRVNRLRLGGLTGVRDEFLLMAIAAESQETGVTIPMFAPLEAPE